ncbi:hypothetical protein PagCFBP13516_18755 [Pantoea agglomerans]|nr:hypothetical protein PagCFBP13516_18755 [Pantoea agglomerans]
MINQTGFRCHFFRIFQHSLHAVLPVSPVACRQFFVSPGVLSAVMLRTEPAGRLCPAPFRGSGFPS